MTSLTIISGGQTGVDRAALDAARQLKVPIAGWCPKGRLAEDGPISTLYPLLETPTSRYPERTERNILDSDGTLLLTFGRTLGGTGLTKKLARKHQKPELRIDLADPQDRWKAASKILKWMLPLGITRLNVAGPRASSAPQAYDLAFRIIKRLLVIWNERQRPTLKPSQSGSAQSPRVAVTATGIPIQKPRRKTTGPIKSESPSSTKSGIQTPTASGGEGSRTLDLSIANAALCQLSYAPGTDEPSVEPATEGGKANSSRQLSLEETFSLLWSDEQIRHIRRELPKWYARYGRELPWIETHDPYRIWVREIMLQQTTVQTVRPFFERFLARFPDIESLSLSTEEEVLRLWEGLGYYSRGRNLRTAAIIIHERYGGRIPQTVLALRELPGIGRYVAGAIASFAYGLRTPIVEANTLRLYCRLLGFQGNPRNSSGQQLLWSFAESILPQKDVGKFNQALMDLGATVCTIQAPACDRCPLRSSCRACAQGTQLVVPQKASRPNVTDVTELTVGIFMEGKVFIRRRSSAERWAGLWDFPRFACETGQHSDSRLRKAATDHLRGEYGFCVTGLEPVTQIKHSVTRYRIDLRCWTARLTKSSPCGELPDEQWILLRKISDVPMSVTGRQFAELLIAQNRLNQ